MLRVVFPAICRTMSGDASKIEIRLFSSELLKAIQKLVRHERIWKWAEGVGAQEEIQRITAGV